QSEYVNVWMHSGMVQVDEVKMSKSLGNFFTIRDVLKQYDAETVRYFLLSSHYRSQLNYSNDNLEQARASLERLYTALRDIEPAQTFGDDERLHDFQNRFNAAMDDDFNVPEALPVLFDIARDLNRAKVSEPNYASELAWLLIRLGGILCALQQAPSKFLQLSEPIKGVVVAAIEALIVRRNDARATKDWAAADAARDELTKLGIELEDGPNGTQWRFKH